MTGPSPGQPSAAIRERIRLGLLAPVAQLPADRDLAEQAGTSRMTARQAVAYLMCDGMLAVKPGIGTFVAEPKLSYDALHLLGFAEESIARGDAVGTEVVEQRVDRPSPRVALALRIMAEEPVVKIVRRRGCRVWRRSIWSVSRATVCWRSGTGCGTPGPNS